VVTDQGQYAWLGATLRDIEHSGENLESVAVHHYGNRIIVLISGEKRAEWIAPPRARQQRKVRGAKPTS
jgi:hypothetical protein